MTNFPLIRDLVVEIADFMRKLTEVKPWIVRGKEKPLSEGEYLQTPSELEEYKQYSMCINCLLCYAACPIYGLEPISSDPPRSRSRSDTTSTGATKALRSGSRSFPSTRGSGAAPSWENAPRSVRRTSDPAGAIQRYKLSAALASLKRLLTPWGAQ